MKHPVWFWITLSLVVAILAAILLGEIQHRDYLTIPFVTPALLVLSSLLYLARFHASGWERKFAVGQLAFSVALLMYAVWVSERRPASRAFDQNSITAGFEGVRVEGPQHQIVFSYRLKNHTWWNYHIRPSDCASLSMILDGKPNTGTEYKKHEFDPAYLRHLGLVRLPAQNGGLQMQPCPLRIGFKQSADVTIPIPWAYPGEVPKDHREEALQQYLSENMPQLQGFGFTDFDKQRQIIFPRGW